MGHFPLNLGVGMRQWVCEFSSTGKTRRGAGRALYLDFLTHFTNGKLRFKESPPCPLRS